MKHSSTKKFLDILKKISRIKYYKRSSILRYPLILKNGQLKLSGFGKDLLIILVPGLEGNIVNTTLHFLIECMKKLSDLADAPFTVENVDNDLVFTLLGETYNFPNESIDFPESIKEKFTEVFTADEKGIKCLTEMLPFVHKDELRGHLVRVNLFQGLIFSTDALVATYTESSEVFNTCDPKTDVSIDSNFILALKQFKCKKITFKISESFCLMIADNLAFRLNIHSGDIPDMRLVTPKFESFVDVSFDRMNKLIQRLKLLPISQADRNSNKFAFTFDGENYKLSYLNADLDLVDLEIKDFPTGDGEFKALWNYELIGKALKYFSKKDALTLSLCRKKDNTTYLELSSGLKKVLIMPCYDNAGQYFGDKHLKIK